MVPGPADQRDVGAARRERLGQPSPRSARCADESVPDAYGPLSAPMEAHPPIR